MEVLTKKERREMSRADKYARSVKNCAYDLFHFSDGGAEVLVSPSMKSAEQFMKDVKKELKRLQQEARNDEG